MHREPSIYDEEVYKIALKRSEQAAEAGHYLSQYDFSLYFLRIRQVNRAFPMLHRLINLPEKEKGYVTNSKLIMVLIFEQTHKHSSMRRLASDDWKSNAKMVELVYKSGMRYKSATRDYVSWLLNYNLKKRVSEEKEKSGIRPSYVT